MENAVKALLISGGTLVTIVVIASGLLIMRNTSAPTQKAADISNSMSLASENAIGSIENGIGSGNGGSLSGNDNNVNGGNNGNNSSNRQGNDALLAIIQQVYDNDYRYGAITSNTISTLRSSATEVRENPTVQAVIANCRRSNFMQQYICEDVTSIFLTEYLYGSLQSYNNHAPKEFDAFLEYTGDVVTKMTVIFYTSAD